MTDEQKHVLDLISSAKSALDDPIVRITLAYYMKKEAEKQLLKEMKKN